MTKSEVRTGNVLQYRGREVVVLEIRQDDFLVRDRGLEMAFHYGSESVSGIPISEGWLEKRLGFEKSKWYDKETVFSGK